VSYQLDAFHQKSLRQQLGIQVRNDEVSQWTGLTSLSHLRSHRRIWVFGHVAQLEDDKLANMALQLHINISLTDFLTTRCIVHLVVYGTSSSTSYEMTPPVPLDTSAGVLSAVDMVEQR